MKNVQQLTHPLICEKIGQLRDKSTSPRDFRETLGQLSRLMAYEALKDVSLEDYSIDTPLSETKAKKLKNDPVFISILRAGNAMLDGILPLVPSAQCGHLGIYRDKFTNNTVEYYFRLPQASEHGHAFLLDPMIATGKTASAAITRLEQCGVEKITFLCLLIAEQAAEYLVEHHPNVQIYCADVEKKIDEKGFLIPGMGDVGGRLYGAN